MIVISDSNPGSSQAHKIEARQGFTTFGGLLISREGDEYLCQSVYTKPDHQGKGVARTLLSYVEEEYGPIIVQSENDPFWEKMGFSPQEDGFWRRSSQ
jgi:GNAT superfamily N-acetyltransferase